MMDVAAFKAALSTKSDSEIVQELIIDGGCSCIDEDEHFKLKRLVAAKYGLNQRGVVIVGSAKLGFSIAPEKAFRSFGNHSDIDIAVVDSALFDKIWREAFIFQSSRAYWQDQVRFFRNLARGWIRPDLMPRSSDFTYRNDWFEFFGSLRVRTSFGAVAPKAGLYKDWHFLEDYQMQSVAGLRE